MRRPTQQQQQPNTVVGPYDEGARIVLECETQNGYPEPELTWWRDGRLVDDSYEIVSASDGLVLAKHELRELGVTRAQYNQRARRLAPSSNLAAAAARQMSNRAQDDDAANTPDGSTSHPPTEQAAADDDDIATTMQKAPTSHNRLIRNRLELSAGLSRADLMANYSCEAWNSKLAHEPPSAYIMIDMNRK